MDPALGNARSGAVLNGRPPGHRCPLTDLTLASAWSAVLSDRMTCGSSSGVLRRVTVRFGCDWPLRPRVVPASFV